MLVKVDFKFSLDVGKNSASENAEILPGDQVIAVNDICADDGQTELTAELKKLGSGQHSLVITRGGLLQFTNLYASSTTPLGLKLMAYDPFMKWLKRLQIVARVKTVAKYSPADEGGIQEGDLIVWANKIFR